MKVAIIGGTGCQHMIDTRADQITIDTRYGVVPLYVHEQDDVTVYYLLRHGLGHTVPPHRVNYRAQIAALRSVGVTHAIGIYAVGSITSLVLPGTIGMIDQFIDMTGGSRESTFYDGADGTVAHVPMVAPYSSQLRSLLAAEASQMNLALCPKGTYICTNGPRLETPAEITMFRRWGADYVGMTAATETILAREANIAFAGLVYSINWAAGLDAEGISFIEQEIADRVIVSIMHLAKNALTALAREHTVGHTNTP